MKFGHLDDLAGVSLQLPPDPSANAARIDRYQMGADDGQPHVYIGATGWSMKAWVGKWYPKGTDSKQYLQQYSLQFNTIELNTTHYRIPDTATIAKWYAESSADFRFCPKLPQFISHKGDLDIGGDATRRFLAAIDGLQEKMGCAFIQLPPYFSHDKLGLLERFLASWPQLLPLAAELRHPSWFSHPAHTEALMDTLAKYRAAAVITDVAGRRDVAHLYVTAPRTMVRFVGNGLHPSDFSRLMDWTSRLRTWRLPEVYFFPHQPDNILSPEASAWLQEQLLQQGWANSRGPKVIPSIPAQQRLF